MKEKKNAKRDKNKLKEEISLREDGRLEDEKRELIIGDYDEAPTK